MFCITRQRRDIQNSICADALDMLLHFSPKASCVKSERDLSHIELERSDNISSLNAVKAYRVGEAHISTEEQTEQEYKDFLLVLLLFLFVIRTCYAEPCYSLCS